MRRLLALLTSLLLLPVVVLAPAQPALALDNGLARTPPMGFNDWNAFGCDVSEKLIKETADYMVSSGMKDAGYQYVNIDDCWLTHERDADGNLVPDPVKFPDGIKGTADYVHGKGLKLGIYEDAGTMTCAKYPGSLGHEQQDAQTFASWGVDYLKYDNCNNAGSTTKEQYIERYTAMRDALAATGRPIVYSICEWGVNDPWTWAPEVGNLWRTTGDINDSYGRMLSIVHQNMPLAQYAKPGAWNDPDMLEIGNGGMTDTEYRSEFSLWAEMVAPLIAGTDLREADAATMAIYLNKEVIRVDQDKLGAQGQVISSADGHDVFSKPLANGDRAVALFNETDAPATISTTAALAGLPSASAYQVRDLWAHKTLETAGRIGAVVPPHGTVMYRVSADRETDAFDPLTSFGLAPTGTAAPQPGTPYPVRTSFTDYGADSVTDVHVNVSAPDGWAVHNTSPAAAARLGTNEALTTDWTVTPPASADPGTYQLEAAVSYRWGNKKESADSTLTVRVPYPPVQAPYRTFSSTQASFGQAGDRFQIVGDGRDTYGSRNEYSAIYLPGAESSGTVAQVRVDSQQPTSDWAKAGIMVRNDITASGTSPGYLIVAVTPGHGYVVQWDSDGNGTLDSNSAPSNEGSGTASYPSWLKLTRDGSSYTGWYSTDGTTWTQIATVDAPGATATQDVGMFMTSHNSGVQGEVDFRDFTTGTTS